MDSPERCSIAGFEGKEREPQAKECRQLLEARKGEDTDSPLEPESDPSLILAH